MERFYEQLLTTKPNFYFKAFNALKAVTIILTIIYIGIAAVTLNFWFILFALITSGLFYIFINLRNKQFKEFEYIYTSGNLQIDVIYNKRNRKTLIDEDIKDIDKFGSASEFKYMNISRSFVLIPWDNQNNKYAFTLDKNKGEVFYIAPDEKMLELINLHLRHRQ